MKVFTLQRKQWIARPIEDVFAFFSRVGNLQEITPRWLNFRVESVSTPEIQRGTLIRYRLRWHVLPVRWATEITRWEPPYCFVDEQISGPYRLWWHQHRFVPRGSGTLMQDTVRYALPFAALGALAHIILVRSDVQAIFDFRAETIAKLFSRE